MAPIKRKADAEGTAPKSGKHSATNPSAKRPRKSDTDASPSKPTAKSQKPAQTSVFKDEERSFPRGGASVLTPLEHKQIQIKATQDVLFEQSGQKRVAEDRLSDEDDHASDDGASAGKKSKKSKKKSKKAKGAEKEERFVRVESLSYKVS